MSASDPLSPDSDQIADHRATSEMAQSADVIALIQINIAPD
jgi:hypothetical protein